MLDLVERGNLATNCRCMAMIKFSKHNGEASVFIPERPPEPHAVISSQSSDRLELPKLVLCPFSGDIAMWNTFLSHDFDIHKNRDLLDINKLNCLNSLLTGTG